MDTPKDLLVVTTSNVEGVKVLRYIKPVTAHLVAGTNFFNDFLGGLTDVFGGRSHTYQKQLVSLYDEAINKLKYNAYELGANCILGLNIDMDEISGKGKSMFMLTAIGTAVVIEKKEKTIIESHNVNQKFENVSIDRINTSSKKKAIIKHAEIGDLTLSDDVWSFITENQVEEVFSYILEKFSINLRMEQFNPEETTTFKNYLSEYLNAQPENRKIDLLYMGIEHKDEKVALKFFDLIKDSNLFDFERSQCLINSTDFAKQKMGLRIASYNKLFYNKQDLENLKILKDLIKRSFLERGTRIFKKQLLSSKEKEMWKCECGVTNELDSYCFTCMNDIYGFKEKDPKPKLVMNHIEEKIELIEEHLLDFR